jgi:hypothetical protein
MLTVSPNPPMERPTLESWPDTSHATLVRRYAEAWNTLDLTVVRPHFASDIHWLSQSMLGGPRGDEVARYLHRSMEHYRNRPELQVRAELALAPGPNRSTVFGRTGEPCVRLESLSLTPRRTSNVVLAMLQTEGDSIREIVRVTMPPGPRRAWRFHLYPWTDR